VSEQSPGAAAAVSEGGEGGKEPSRALPLPLLRRRPPTTTTATAAAPLPLLLLRRLLSLLCCVCVALLFFGQRPRWRKMRVEYSLVYS